MKIYTSYFGKSKDLARNGIIPVCIALGKPRFFNGMQLLYLAPKRYMLSGDLTREQYIETYKREILDKVDVNMLRMDIKGISQGRDVALCCYEKPGDFCHRHIFAEWLNEKFNAGIVEFGFDKPLPVLPVEKEEIKQNSLF